MLEEKEVQKYISVTPRYYRYGGGFTKLNMCVSCKRIGLKEDMHEIDACVECGGEVRAEALVGYWVKPRIVVDKRLFGIPITFKKLPGYWELKE